MHAFAHLVMYALAALGVVFIFALLLVGYHLTVMARTYGWWKP